MISVTPKYYLIADPSDTGELERFLKDQGIAWRPDPSVSFTENLMEFAGRLCYESWQTEDGDFLNLNLTRIREGNKEYLGNIIKQKHGSVFEHGGLVVLFSDVSRVFTHELVRHRAGCGFSQTSSRYVRLDELKFWIPPCIEENPEAKKIFTDVIAQCEDAQRRLAEIYSIDTLPFDQKKKLTSAFRRIAPNGLANNILMSTNHRAMRHMITMRASKHAEEEIQLLFSQLAVDLKSRFPGLYQDLYEEDGSWLTSNNKI
jgi:thymidylate synthase (FAD)